MRTSTVTLPALQIRLARIVYGKLLVILPASRQAARQDVAHGHQSGQEGSLILYLPEIIIETVGEAHALSGPQLAKIRTNSKPVEAVVQSFQVCRAFAEAITCSTP